MYETCNSLLVAASVTCLPLLIEFLLRRKHERSRKEQCLKWTMQNSSYHCIFWTMENMACKPHFLNNQECSDNCSTAYLQTVAKVIASAQISISMCMYHLTMKQITEELVAAHQRGVVIRIITDNATSQMKHSKLKLLKSRYGFEVQTPQLEDSLMHHKYCIIDAEDSKLGKMFLGSLNLTLQGVVANFEFVVITNNSSMLQKYLFEFNALWHILKTN